jgi:hypothetical protein
MITPRMTVERALVDRVGLEVTIYHRKCSRIVATVTYTGSHGRLETPSVEEVPKWRCACVTLLR